MRQFGISLILCIAPIIGAPSLGALLYPDTIGRQAARPSEESTSLPSDTSKQVEEEPAAVAETSGSEADWISAGASSDFDPNSNADFVLSFRVRTTSSPKLNKRQRLIRKYNQSKNKASGWGVAFKRFDASIRPELFFNDEQGHGEWFTFDSVSLEPGRWLQLFVVRRKDGSTGLFCKREGEAADQVRSLGGYDTSKMDLISNPAELVIAPPVIDTAEFKGEVEDVVIIRPESLPKSEAKLVKLLSDYALKPEETFTKEEIKLSVGKDKRDRSIYAHPLKVVR